MAKFEFEYTTYSSIDALSLIDQQLVNQAKEAALNLAYAPYSGFKVGVAILLDNDIIVQGSNQENAAFPAGLCAERVALGVVSSMYPQQKIIKIAVNYHKEHISPALANEVLSPCGTCRQAIAEQTGKQSSSIGLLLCSASGTIISIKNAMDLLPMSFGAKML